MVIVKKMVTLMATLIVAQTAAGWNTPYSEAVVNKSYHNSDLASSSSGGLEPLYSLVHRFFDLVVPNDGDDLPLGLNSTVLLGDPEEQLPLHLQLQMQLRAQLSEHWEDKKTQGCGQSMFQPLAIALGMASMNFCLTGSSMMSSRTLVGLTRILIVQRLPDSGWADGNLADVAGQLGKLMEHLNLDLPRCTSRLDTLYLII